MFKPIPGFEGHYSVNDKGDVFSEKSNVLMRPTLKSNGYLSYGLYINGGYKYYSAHRLVAMAWLGIPENASHLHVAHIDGCKTNNVLSNLRWSTVSENSLDKKNHGKLKGAYPGERHHNSKLTASIVAQMRDRVRLGEKFMDVIKDFGVKKITAYDSVIGKTWKTVNAISQPVALKNHTATQ